MGFVIQAMFVLHEKIIAQIFSGQIKTSNSHDSKAMQVYGHVTEASAPLRLVSLHAYAIVEKR